MSVIRQIKIKYDLEKIEQICHELGLFTARNVPIKNIIGSVIDNPEEVLYLAIAKQKGDKFNIGFTIKNGETYLYVDRYYKDNNAIIENILTKYIINSLYPYYHMAEIKNKSPKEIVMVFRR
ncbi:MAG: hypothetical protein RMJ67_07735 [Elusimicrobiota bacterium]|nr:hypothetical protein [Endomicrobiia bacterium]MDW8166383.1 hypothetical protein [Elusimicrobiota bacterium]